MKTKLLSVLFVGSVLFTVSSCLSDADETIAIEYSSSIPDKDNPAPTVTDPNTNIPNPSQNAEEYEGEYVIRLDMTGVWDPNKSDWMYLKGTGENGQNVWLTIDGEPKGFVIHNTSDDNGNDKVMKADLVFVVDNSGSMNEEADVIANDISEWASILENHGLDIRFGCVGYSVSGSINGAIDITSALELSNFLDYKSGTSRTMHFDGTNGSTLNSRANSFRSVNDECGGMAIQFADSYFSFRNGSNRIYVNFTDEPNQPAYVTRYSTEYYKNYENWSPDKGTVHTIYSDQDTTYTHNIGLWEKPWRISQYTGGTYMITNPSFTGISLSSLPVSGAMQNSYIIRFRSTEDLKDGMYHTVIITIKSVDGSVRAQKVLNIKFE